MHVILIYFFILGSLEEFLQQHLGEGEDVTGWKKQPEVAMVDETQQHDLSTLLSIWDETNGAGEDVTGWKINSTPKQPEVTVPTDEPKHTEYSTVESRVKSFKGMKTKLPVKRQVFAEAGFFYMGVKDHVQCFYCGGALRDWKKGLNPYQEHAGWYGSQCLFLRAVKGKEFAESFGKSEDGFYPYTIQSYPV